MSGGEEPRYRVAFQGELGAYSEEAVRRYFGDDARPVPRREFADVGDAVAGGRVDYGLLPIENTLAGSVVGSYDVLAGGEVEVVGEVIAPIHHCLLAVPEAAAEDLRRILSHPVALAQCSDFLSSRREIEAVAHYDTAGAARTVSRKGDRGVAAIASLAAAERYGLKVLGRNIEDRPDNQTRFLVVGGRGASTPRPSRSDGDAGEAGEAGKKTALLVETENAPGALLRVLEPFAEEEVNLSKLESRPGERPWTYRFFMELETGAGSAAAGRALASVEERSTALRVLGSYPRWTEPGTEPGG